MKKFLFVLLSVFIFGMCASCDKDDDNAKDKELYQRLSNLKINWKDYIHTVKHPQFHDLLTSIDTVMTQAYKGSQLFRVTIESEKTANYDSIPVMNLGDLKAVDIYYNINDDPIDNCLHIFIREKQASYLFYHENVKSSQKIPEVSAIPILFTEAEIIIKNKNQLQSNIHSNIGELKVINNKYVTEPLIIFNEDYGVGVYSGNIVFY
jgi:hypothetical protein